MTAWTAANQSGLSICEHLHQMAQCVATDYEPVCEQTHVWLRVLVSSSLGSRDVTTATKLPQVYE